MHFDPNRIRVVAALLYAAGAAFSLASLWLVLSEAFGFDEANRDFLLLEMRPVLLTWLLVCGAGAVFAVLAFRFATLSASNRRAMLATSCVVAAVAGFWLEWWQSLYFLVPAVLLGLAFRGAAHA
jgi:hypothetical protein